jgi:hypothetical protein
MRFCGPNQEDARTLAESIPGVEFCHENTSIEEAAKQLFKIVEQRGNVDEYSIRSS